MQPNDWPEVARIYEEGIATGIATFETQVPTYADWDQAHLKICRLVFSRDDRLAGWAALSPVSGRCVYGGVAEVSRLIPESEANGIWTLQSGIFPENLASIRLHEKVGFRKLGVRERIGKRDGQWKDNVLFERRSRVVGIDES